MPPTIKDVARLAGVSTASVSHVINEKQFVSQEMRLRVQKAMEELEYYPSAVARSLRVRRTRTVGLIVPELSNKYFTEVAHGIEEVLQKNGYSLIISESGDDAHNERELVQVYDSLHVDGLIMVPCGPKQHGPGGPLRGNCPTVFVDRKPDGPRVDAVVLDNYNATYEGVSTLLDRGHRRIGAILGAKWYSTTRDRIRGYVKAHRDRGLEVDKELIRHGDYGVETGRALGAELLGGPMPTALFVASSYATLGAFMIAKEMGFSIPGDLAILGCDDLSWARATEPPLSMVVHPTSEMGKKTSELLLKRIADPGGRRETIHLPTKIRFRGSI